MRRRDFVRLALPVPIAGFARGLSGAEQDAGPRYRVPQADSLLMRVGDRRDRYLTYLRHLELDPVSWSDLASGYRLAFAYSGPHKLLYISYADSIDASARSFLKIINFGGALRPKLIEYPGRRTTAWVPISLVLSPDGLWLYTICSRYFTAPLSRIPPSASNPLPNGIDGNVLPQIYVYTFDASSGKFLPRTSSGQPGTENIQVVPRRGSRQFDVYDGGYPSSRVRVGEDGSSVNDTRQQPPAIPGGEPTYKVQNPVNDTTYLIHPGKVIALNQEDANVRNLDPVPDGFKLSQPAISGDGKIVLVPYVSEDSTGKAAVEWIATVYRTDDFFKIRQMSSKLRLSGIQLNHDGSTIYAGSVRTSNRLYCLDRETLAVTKELAFDLENFDNLYVIP